MGLPLAIIAGAFLLYCFTGQYLPDPFVHRGYTFDQVIDHFAYDTEGIYGTPVYVSAAYIFIFGQHPWRAHTAGWVSAP